MKMCLLRYIPYSLTVARSMSDELLAETLESFPHHGVKSRFGKEGFVLNVVKEACNHLSNIVADRFSDPPEHNGPFVPQGKGDTVNR